MKRRKLIQNLGLASAGVILSSCKNENPLVLEKESVRRLGNINHSVCRWCYFDLSIEELADAAKDLKMKSVELLDPEEWDAVLDRGLDVALSNGSKLGITNGFNDPKNHEQLKQDYFDLIKKAADKGIDQIICFSGNRNGISDQEGLENCAQGLKDILAFAERQSITITMELLNSKVDHFDYQCDHTAWGVALVEKIGSPNFKLLYDIYHMQVMEGDVIATIEKNKAYISHFHTGGVPGRNEINQSQELNYPAIMNALKKIEFKGYVAQEFIPTRKDVIASLREGVNICDV